MQQSNPNTHGDSYGNRYPNSNADTNPHSDTLHVACGSKRTKRNQCKCHHLHRELEQCKRRD